MDIKVLKMRTKERDEISTFLLHQGFTVTEASNYLKSLRIEQNLNGQIFK
jgi:hypothetical protein